MKKRASVAGRTEQKDWSQVRAAGGFVDVLTSDAAHKLCQCPDIVGVFLVFNGVSVKEAAMTREEA